MEEDSDQDQHMMMEGGNCNLYSLYILCFRFLNGYVWYGRWRHGTSNDVW
jgi:hypothetical protein